MAAVEVTISGVLYDKHSRTMQSVVLIGEASLSGVGVGGGPLPGGPGGGQPPGIWPPSPGHPSHPIYTPPGAPAYPDHGLPGAPPGYWGGVAPPHPDQGLPVPPGGSLPPLPEVPPELASSVIVAVHKPGQEWVVKSYPVTPGHPIILPPIAPDNTLPATPPA